MIFTRLFVAGGCSRSADDRTVARPGLRFAGLSLSHRQMPRGATLAAAPDGASGVFMAFAWHSRQRVGTGFTGERGGHYRRLAQPRLK